MEQRILLVENLVQQMQTTLKSVQDAQNLAEAGHQQVHKEMADLRKIEVEIERLKSGSGYPGGGDRNDRNLVPEVYAMDKSKWQAWALKIRRYMNRRHAGIADKLLEVGGPLSPQALTDADVSQGISEDIKDYLTAKTEAEAGVIVRSAQRLHALEIWRRLSFASEPMGTFSELRDTRQATRPSRCNKPGELASHFASFEDRLLKLTERTGSCPLTQEGKRWAILDMVPSYMEKELESQVHLFKTYEDLKAHSLDLAARRAPAPEVHNLEEGPIEFCNDAGEICRLEKTRRKMGTHQETPKQPPK